MTKGFKDDLKKEFSFLNIDEKLFETVFEKFIDTRKSDIENKNRICNLFYEIIRDSLKENGYSIIVQYIENNFNMDNLNSCIDSLNKLTTLLEECMIDINVDNYKKLTNESKKLLDCLNIINTSNNLLNNETFKLLNDKSIEFIDYYNENNSFLSENFKDVLDIDESEIEKELQSNDLFIKLSDPSDALKCYLNSIGNKKILTSEEEYALTKQYSETHDKKIRDKIIESNLRLVVSIAKKVSIKFPNIPILDLISAGNEGLFRAIKDYDPDKARFTTYATFWITQKIRRYIQDNYSNIRIPVHLQEKIYNYYQEKKKLEEKLNRDVTIQDIKEHLGLSDKEITEYENNISKTISLNAIIHNQDEDTELGDFISAGDDVIPEEIIIKNDESSVEYLLSNLTDVEKTIIKLRTGIYDGKEYTLDQIAKMLHKLGLKNKSLTKERIRQLEFKAKRKVKKNYENYEQRIQKIDQKNKNYLLINQPVSINDVVYLLRNTDVDIMSYVLDRICKSYKSVLKECFGDDILAAELKRPHKNMIKYLLNVVYPRLLYDVNKRKKNMSISKTILPSSIYEIDSNSKKEDVDRQIDELEPFERLALNKFYDMYTGKEIVQMNSTLYEKELIVKILLKIKSGLNGSRVVKKSNHDKISKNKLLEYFSEYDSNLVISIIDTLSDDEIDFLHKWYGINYDIDPRINGDLYKLMNKDERNRIFRKIKTRLNKFKKLQDSGVDISYEEASRIKYINRCPKNNIYTYFEFEGYTEEQISEVINELSYDDKELLSLYYGLDLKNPILNNHIDDKLKTKILINIYRKVSKKLREKNNGKVIRKRLKR